MRRSIRCRHGMDRDPVPCPGCGDVDADSLRESRPTSTRRAVISRPHGGKPRRKRLAYARRERVAGR